MKTALLLPFVILLEVTFAPASTPVIVDDFSSSAVTLGARSTVGHAVTAGGPGGWVKRDDSAWSVAGGVMSNTSTVASGTTAQQRVSEGAISLVVNVSDITDPSIDRLTLGFDYTAGDAAEVLYVHFWGYVSNGDPGESPTTFFMNHSAQSGNAWEASDANSAIGTAGPFDDYNLGYLDGSWPQGANEGQNSGAAAILTGTAGPQRYYRTFDLSANTVSPNHLAGYDYLVLGFARNVAGGTPSMTIDNLTLSASADSADRSEPQTLDAGGERITGGTSTTVVHNGSLGGIGGISTATGVTTVAAKHSYVGQLYDLEALQLTATPLTVDEDDTRQISATLVMDDDTTLAASGGFTWSVTAGPMSIDTNGLATGQPVYQDTLATAQASAGSAIGTLDLTVLDTLPDNFGSYAADGIDDDWQFQYFGLDNSDAAPLIDSDHDGQNNRFEFIAGLVPTDPLSRFSLSIAPVPGQPAQKDIIFDPIVAGRIYTVVTSSDLMTGSWVPLIGGSFSDNGDQRTIVDPSASGPRKFYSIRIEKP